MELTKAITEGGTIGIIVVSILILFKMCQKYGANFKCGPINLDLRKPQTKQKQLKYESEIDLSKLKVKELELKIREKETELEIIKEKNKFIKSAQEINDSPDSSIEEII
tara:strand:- start:123 stop:449 length:327 start_codon:yes stop_codon:yes gene_type:complete